MPLAVDSTRRFAPPSSITLEKDGKNGAGDEIRTRDLLVGNEKLYH